LVKTFKLNNLEGTLEQARQLALKLIDSNTSYALLLYGGMGAGKTTFIRELGRALGIQEKITSPTFIGLNEYHLDDLNFYHFDLYQVGTSFEDLSEIVSTNNKIILAIEWAEKLNPNLLSYLENNLSILELKFLVIDDEARELSVKEKGKI
jgi:tRNA threonylcarbamoyladenosine biosynthesis protein TsaE